MVIGFGRRKVDELSARHIFSVKLGFDNRPAGDGKNGGGDVAWWEN